MSIKPSKRNSEKSSPALWAPLVLLVFTCIVDLFTEFILSYPPSGNGDSYKIIVFPLIYSFIIYYYLIYGLLTLARNILPLNFPGIPGLVSLLTNILIIAIITVMPATRSGSIWGVTMSIPMIYVWGMPGVLLQWEVNSLGESMAACVERASFDLEGAALEDLLAKEYRLHVNHAIFDHQGGIIVNLNIKHRRYAELGTRRFFRFDMDGNTDAAFIHPAAYPEYSRVIPLPDGRMIFHPDYGKGAPVPAIIQDKDSTVHVKIKDIRQIQHSYAVSGTEILAGDGFSIYSISIPEKPDDRVSLEAKLLVNFKEGMFPGYSADGFTFRPGKEGRILYAIKLKPEDGRGGRKILHGVISPGGREIFRWQVFHNIFQRMDNAAVIDPQGGLIYIDGPVVARIEPGGRDDSGFRQRFNKSAGIFHRIDSISIGRDGRILAAGSHAPDNRPKVLLLEQDGTKVMFITFYRE